MFDVRGMGVALVTPFTLEGQIDVAALRALVESCISGGVDYLVALGTTAEVATLSVAERHLVCETIVKTNAERLPVVLGLGGNNTHALVQELQRTDLEPYAAILSVSPYYNKPTQEGIYEHFKALAHASTLPIILYNVPGRTGSNMLPETTLRLAKDFSNVIAVKEASGDLVQISNLIKNGPEGFAVLSGDDIGALPAIAAGASGVISVLGQAYPEHFGEMVRLGLQGRTDEAYRLHYRLQEAMELIFVEGNPSGIKAILSFKGLIHNALRLPLMRVTPQLGKRIKSFHDNFLRASVAT